MSELNFPSTAEVTSDPSFISTLPIAISCNVCREHLYTFESDNAESHIKSMTIGDGRTPYQISSEDEGKFLSTVPKTSNPATGFILECMIDENMCNGFADMGPLKSLQDQLLGR